MFPGPNPCLEGGVRIPVGAIFPWRLVSPNSRSTKVAGVDLLSGLAKHKRQHAACQDPQDQAAAEGPEGPAGPACQLEALLAAAGVDKTYPFPQIRVIFRHDCFGALLVHDVCVPPLK